MPDRLVFDSLLDLARLPYFRVAGGRLVLADRSLGPAVDVHTHLALSFVLPPSVDLLRETPRTEHYLPADRRIDFDVYANKNYTPGDLRALERDLVVGSLGATGMRATHTIPNLEREMRDLGILRSVLLPIDFPLASRNARTWLDATRGRPAFIGFGSVHPYAPNLARRLDEQIAAGARGIKVHPAVQVVRPDNHRAMRLYRLCAERRLPILFHCGPVGIEPRLQRRLTQVRWYERPIAENPRATIVLGHSGALQVDGALRLARKYRNVHLEVSSQSLPCIRRIVDEVDAERVLFGTDWPFYPQAIQLAKVLLATEGRPEARRRVLYDNAARLFGLPPAMQPTPAAEGSAESGGAAP